MVVVNSICCLISAIIDNTFYQLFVLVFSSAPKSGIAVAQYFYFAIPDFSADEKTKTNNGGQTQCCKILYNFLKWLYLFVYTTLRV